VRRGGMHGATARVRQIGSPRTIGVLLGGRVATASTEVELRPEYDGGVPVSVALRPPVVAFDLGG
jgi:hypothetical protein